MWKLTDSPPEMRPLPLDIAALAFSKVSLSPSGDYLFAITSDGSGHGGPAVGVLDLRSESWVAQLLVPEAEVEQVFSVNGTRVAVTYKDALGDGVAVFEVPDTGR